jgi:hypothetical protein
LLAALQVAIRAATPARKIVWAPVLVVQLYAAATAPPLAPAKALVLPKKPKARKMADTPTWYGICRTAEQQHERQQQRQQHEELQ